MKKFTIALLALVMLLCWGGTPALALEHPYNYNDPIPSGDDHPWGGDDTGNPPTTIKNTDNPVVMTTGTADIIGSIFINYFYYDLRLLFEKTVRVPEKQATIKARSYQREILLQKKEGRR